MTAWLELLGQITTYVLFGAFAAASLTLLGMIAWKSLRLPARHALEPAADVDAAGQPDAPLASLSHQAAVTRKSA